MCGSTWYGFLNGVPMYLPSLPVRISAFIIWRLLRQARLVIAHTSTVHLASMIRLAFPLEYCEKCFHNTRPTFQHSQRQQDPTSNTTFLCINFQFCSYSPQNYSIHATTHPIQFRAMDDIVQITDCRDQVTALRGFKVRSQTLDKYLAANGDTTGTRDGSFPPYYQFDNDGVASHDMSNILRSRMTAIGSNDDSNGILVIVPSVYCHCRSPWVYVAYSYAFIYSQRLITAESLPKQVPRGFEELRQEVLGYSSSPNQGDEGRMGLYIVCTFDRQTPLPAEIQQRGRVRKRLRLSR